MTTDESPRFADREVALLFDGEPVPVETVAIPSANPTNYYAAIHDAAAPNPVVLEGRLFAPPVAHQLPGVVLVPGSAGVVDSHLAAAQTLVDNEIAVLIVDPFGERAVISTAADQTQFSLAASALDVLRALQVMAKHDSIDATRIAAQGTSRGGFAVLVAAMRRFADPIVGQDLALAGVYAAWPFSGHQFADANVGSTKVRAVIGSRDDWVPVPAVQAQIRAISLAGGDASISILAGAHHGFDRPEGISRVPDAMISPGSPMVFIDDDGSLIEPRIGEPDPTLTDTDIFRADVRDGFGGVGASVGGTLETEAWFKADMMNFYTDLFGLN